MRLRDLCSLPIARRRADENRDCPIRAATGQHKAVFVGSPCDAVDGALVARVLVDFVPFSILFGPYNDTAVVAAGSEEVSVNRVRPA